MMTILPPEVWLTRLSERSLGNFTLTPTLDLALSRQALLARDSDVAREELFRLLAFKIERFVSRFRRWNLAPWGMDDVVQEAYLVLDTVLHEWRPQMKDNVPHGFGAYFLIAFPFRLNDRVRQWSQHRQGQPPISTLPEDDSLPIAAVDLEQNVEAWELLIALQAELDPDDADLLLLKATGMHTSAEIADRFGISVRTYYRRWAKITATIKQVPV